MEYPSVLLMWLTMTGVMMAPVVLPWLRALSRIADGGTVSSAGPRAAVGPFATVGPFAAGYAVAWAGFSAAAAGFHLALSRMSVPVPFGLEAPALSAAALFLAGGFQFTRLKEACLSHCRSPAGYLLTHWRSGPAGHARLGFGHGLHCVGCCWALMALALVVGMINLGWMGLLMAVMVAETTLPGGARLRKPVGAALLATGLAVLIVAR